MDRYVCTICGYVYDPAAGDPDNGIDPGTKFEDLPDERGRIRRLGGPPTAQLINRRISTRLCRP